MRFLSLFDGCHMFGLALRNVGMECVGTAEIEKHPRAVTRYHYPDTPQLGDVRNVTPETVGPVDLIVGGWPCQGNSVAGDRGGMADERSGLFSEVVRCAGALAPRWLVLENVPGLLSVNDGRDMAAVVGTLGELGYGVAWRVLDAQHFGVPQRRRRVFIVGCRGDVGRAAAVLFEPESVRGDSAPGGEAGAGVAGAPRSRSAVGVLGDVAHTLDSHSCGAATEDGTGRGTPRPAGVAPTLGAEFGAKQGLDDQHINSQAGGLFVADTGRGTPLVPALSHALTAAKSGQRNDPTEATFLVADMVQMTNPDTRSNPKPGDPAPTLAESSRLTVSVYQCHGSNVGPVGTLRAGNAGTTGGVPFGPTGSGVRRLMPLECERLQGLPDEWTRHGRKPDGTTYEIKDGPRYRMIGNGGAVPVVEWIGRRIMENP